MRFKLSLLLALAGTVFASCAINEGPPPQRKRQIKDGNGCLQDFKQKMERYFDGELSDGEIDALAKCTTDAIVRFQNVVRGKKSKGSFTAAEVRDFLQYYYFDDFQVSDALLAEVMRVKTTLLGGQNGEFAASDLDRAKQIIETIADQLKIVGPHMPFRTERLKKLPVARIEETIRAVKTISQNISGHIVPREEGYTLTDFDRLLSEIERAFPNAKSIAEIRKQIPMAASVKEALISPESDKNRITGKDWKVLLEDGADWYGIYLRFMHLDENFKEWSRGEGRERLSFVMNEVFTLLERIPNRHSHKGCTRDSNGRETHCHREVGVLPFELLFKVIDDSGWDGSVMGTQFSITTVKKEIIPIATRILGGTDLTAQGRKAHGITVEALERGRQAFNEWNEGARYLEGLYQKLTGRKDFPRTAAFSAEELGSVSLEEAITMNGAMTALAKEMAEDLRRIIVNDKAKGIHPQTGPALRVDDSTRVQFEYDLFTRPKTYGELVNYAWARPLLRLVIKGYLSGSAERIEKRSRELWKNGLNEKEFIRFVADFWPALVDFKFVGRENSPSLDGAKRFMEANLFSFAGNGDNEIDVNEGTHLLLFLISTNSISDEILKFSHQVCPQGPEDEFGVKTVEPKCFRENVLNFDPETAPLKDLYRSFPHFMEHYEGLSASERSSLGRALLKPVRTNANLALEKQGQDPYVESSEVDALIMMIHYVEALYMRFDTGGIRGKISYGESKAAYRIFKRTLGKFAEMKPDSFKLRAVFTWLLTRGSPPNPKKRKDLLEFLGWMGKGKAGGVLRGGRQWRFECDRSTIINVFGTITAMADDSGSDSAKLDAALKAEDPWIDYIKDWDPSPLEPTAADEETPAEAS